MRWEVVCGVGGGKCGAVCVSWEVGGGMCDVGGGRWDV